LPTRWKRIPTMFGDMLIDKSCQAGPEGRLFYVRVTQSG
jgi:hypothetical protein